jgi:hypothetical protein
MSLVILILDSDIYIEPRDEYIFYIIKFDQKIVSNVKVEEPFVGQNL